MHPSGSESVTDVLHRLNDGDSTAWQELFRLVDDSLQALAQNEMRRERRDDTLQPTALVHEAFLRLAGGELPRFEGRSHFLGITARAMRQILIERHRHRSSLRKGGDAKRLSLEAVANRPSDPPTLGEDSLEALTVALEDLGGLSGQERKVRVVEQLFLNGRSIAEAAEALGISEATVSRDWRFARAWLFDRLTRESGGSR